MGTSVLELAKTELTDTKAVFDATIAAEVQTDAVEWVDGEPSSCSILVVLDDEYATGAPAREADEIRSIIDSALDETNKFAAIDILGHGTFTSGPNDGRLAVALLVD